MLAAAVVLAVVAVATSAAPTPGASALAVACTFVELLLWGELVVGGGVGVGVPV